MERKRVTFSKIVTVHVVEYVDRRGLWVSDRVHFQKRIFDTEKILNVILDPQHRLEVMKRFETIEYKEYFK